MQMLGIRSPKSRFTRMCIGDAIIDLLKDSGLRELKISAVVHRAGVSRMTFYKYFTTLQSALEDYLQNVIAEYVELIDADGLGYAFLGYEQILTALNFFDRYRAFFLTMKRRGLYALLVDNVNRFMTEYIPTSERFGVYQRYAYAGSLINCFIAWEENGKQEPAEDIAHTLDGLYGSIQPESET